MSGRPCSVSDVLADLVEAVRPLAHKQQRMVELSKLSDPLQVAVEEPALRQALSNLIEGALLRTHAGGKVEIVFTGAPAGGTLVVIDDDGPDMHYMVKIVNSPLCQLFSNTKTRHCGVPSLCYICICLLMKL
jgi:C4-dicarboxylate-specific signal transduction histidine kinase